MPTDTQAPPHAGLSVRLARDPDDLIAAQRLRYEVFVRELGATGPLVDHVNGRESDSFDAIFEHLLLVDDARDPGAQDHVVGLYRLMTGERMQRCGRFCSEDEFDLTALKSSGRKLLELGRSCVHADYRGGPAMLLLWNGLADFVLDRGIEVMFGAASFHGTDPAAVAQALSFLHHAHLAPPGLRVRAKGPNRQDMTLLPPEEVSRTAALAQLPALIRAYLRLGGFVGDGAFIDRAFNTIDVCLVMDTERMSARHRDFYIRRKGRDA